MKLTLLRAIARVVPVNVPNVSYLPRRPNNVIWLLLLFRGMSPRPHWWHVVVYFRYVQKHAVLEPAMRNALYAVIVKETSLPCAWSLMLIYVYFHVRTWLHRTYKL